MQKSSYTPSFPTEIIEEGTVKIMVPKLGAYRKIPSDYAPSKAPVFYNPVMRLNRDLAVLAFQAYRRMLDHDISVSEPLTGCGIKGIRFAAEVEGVKRVLIGDINENAFRLAALNVEMNGLGEYVEVEHEEANSLLGQYSAPRKRFDAVDIDPFGSPVPFLDSALRALRDGGLLALTATDLAPLCGVHPKACIRKYGGKPLRTEYCHELAVRILAGCLAVTAAKQEIGVNVVFSHCTDHYLRVYATIKHGAKWADESLRNMGYVLHCFRCFHREVTKGLFLIQHSGECRECGSKLSFAGPLWTGRILDRPFCLQMEKELKKRQPTFEQRTGKIVALTTAEVEAPITYYVIDKLCDALNLPVPSVKKVADALKREAFQVYPTHFDPKGIKTDAPSMKVMEILKEIMGCN
jgi:tRNA (guanine26-N2/guanine27-N2)-dimethyltransferase